MLRRSVVVLAVLALSGCAGRNWSMGAAILAPPREVARALGETSSDPEAFDVRAIPQVPAPESTRPCCAFGMDLGIALSGKVVPGFTVPNVKSARDLGPHEYDKGAFALDTDLSRFATSENNGLVYTCRGGFFDSAHVRDYADLTLFLTLRFVLGLEHGLRLDVPGDGAVRHLELSAVPANVLEREGRWALATALAQWVAYQFSQWHEVVSWYGLESFKGFSERASTFSPEDLYSNVVGIRLAGGILTTRGIHSRKDWDAQLEAWMREALVRLKDVPEKLGRRAMASLDGRWWDSKRTFPDVMLVKRRGFPSPTLTPWRLEDAGIAIDPVLAQSCEGSSALTLPAPNEPAGHFIKVRFEVGAWAPVTFPLIDATHREVSVEQFPELIEQVHREMLETFGPDFDHP
jgi:hypothetical protein